MKRFLDHRQLPSLAKGQNNLGLVGLGAMPLIGDIASIGGNGNFQVSVRSVTLSADTAGPIELIPRFLLGTGSVYGGAFAIAYLAASTPFSFTWQDGLLLPSGTLPELENLSGTTIQYWTAIEYTVHFED